MCGVQSICSGLMGKERDFLESFLGDDERAGHVMPGYKMNSEENGKIVTKEYFTNPNQTEIDKQDTPFLRSCWKLYTDYKLFGLPHAKGMLKEKPSVISIIEICERESNSYESWYMKNRNDLKDRG